MMSYVFKKGLAALSQGRELPSGSKRTNQKEKKAALLERWQSTPEGVKKICRPKADEMLR